MSILRKKERIGRPILPPRWVENPALRKGGNTDGERSHLVGRVKQRGFVAGVNRQECLFYCSK